MALAVMSKINFSNSMCKARYFLHPKHVMNVCPQAGVLVWERDRKGPYRKKRPLTDIQMIKEGVKSIGREVKLFINEAKDTLACDPFEGISHGDYEYQWKFNDHKSVEDWVVTSDKDNNEGLSVANFKLTKNNTGIFYGYLNTKLLKDGIIKKTGYCNIRSPYKVKSFQRKQPYLWGYFNCLVLKVRGDGRPYAINLEIQRHFDVLWNDQFNYVIFTKGGPYWQIVKIPFSKFFASSKGRIQDKQYSLLADLVAGLGFTQADSYDGPFALEIDYIALLNDKNHTERFAYEMYEANPAHVGT